MGLLVIMHVFYVCAIGMFQFSASLFVDTEAGT